MKQNMIALILTVLCLLIMLCTISAGADVPEGYPAIIEGLDFGGADVYIYDWWSTGERVENPTEEQQRQYDYWDWLEETYHVHVIQVALSGWSDMPQELAQMVENKDDSRLCIVAVSGGFAGDSLKNDLYMPWTYGLDQGNAATQDFMTRNGVCYGTSWGKNAEPRQGVFFNKRILEDAGIDWNGIYDAQGNGTWTWDMMEGYMNAVQRDTDGDGEIDIWGLTGSGDEITIGLVVSNGADFYGFNEENQLAPTIESIEMREALECRIAWNVYLCPSSGWNGYQTNWAEGKAAFMIAQAYEGFNSNGSVNQVDEWGFVAMPKGPRADIYKTSVLNNVYGVPNVYDEATALKLEQLYTLWTGPVPGADENAWASSYYALTDDRAVEESYGMLREEEHTTVLKYNLLGDQNSTVSEILWNMNGGSAEEIIEAALPAFQERCAAYNMADNLAWLLENGVLTIGGEGPMKGHPWTSQADEITEVIIGEGITSICDEAFTDCVNMTSIRIPRSMKSIGGAFDGCTSLADVYYNGIELDWWPSGSMIPQGGNMQAWNALLEANIHYAETQEIENSITIQSVKTADTEEEILPQDDGVYEAECRQKIVITFSAPDIPGYTKTFRLKNGGMWWYEPLMPDEEGNACKKTEVPLTEGGPIAFRIITVYESETDGPVLVSDAFMLYLRGISNGDSGAKLNAPPVYFLGEEAEGYAFSILIPDGIPAEKIGDWSFHLFAEEPTPIYGLNSNDAGGLPQENLMIPEDILTAGQLYRLSFSMDITGYDSVRSEKEIMVYGGKISDLETMILPGDLKRIEDQAFAGAGFQAAILPAGCEYIGHEAFKNCVNLIYVRCSSGTVIEEDAFSGCDRLTGVNMQ